MKINWAIICYRESGEGIMEVLHICCYPGEPGQLDWDSLKEELETDPEFDLIGEEYQMAVISRETDPEVFDNLGIPEEIDPADNLESE